MPSTVTIAAPAFTALLEVFRTRFLLPREQVGRYLDGDVDELLVRIQSLEEGADPDGDGVIWLAEHLPRRSLSLLFPALLRTEDPTALARIVRVLEIRATCSLHDLGWAYFQHHYSDARLASAFAALHAEWKRRDPKACAFPPVFDEGSFDGTLPAKVFAMMTVQGVKRVGPFFASLGLLEDAAFARAVLVLFFSSCPDAGLVDNAEAFVRMLPALDADDGAKVMQYYLREHRLGPLYREINQGVLRTIGPPDSGHAVWQNVPEKIRARFWKWLVARSVEDHLAENPRKFGLLVRYVPYMESVRLISEDILVMGFGGFYLVDDRRTPKLCYYYEKAVFEMWLETLVSEQHAHKEKDSGEAADESAPEEAAPEAQDELEVESVMPSVPTQQAKRIVMEDIRASAVLLDFPEVGVLFARDFLDGVLGIGRKEKSAQTGRLF